MGKSFRKTRIIGNCAGSEKNDKRINNRIFRRNSKQLVLEDDKILPTKPNHVLNNWNFKKDGKHYMKIFDIRFMRK